MKIFTAVSIALAATALAAPVLEQRSQPDTLYISSSNATQLVQEYAPVFSLTPSSFSASDVQQPMGFLDFSGYVEFFAGLLYTGEYFIKQASQAIADLSINELNVAITNVLMGLLKYLNGFLAATRQGTRFDKAVYTFLINSGLTNWLTNVAIWLVNFSNKILGSPFLQGVIDLLKKIFQWVFSSRQVVQNTLGENANLSGFDRAMLAANSVQAAAQKKLNGN